jgi:hypothetical protein
MRDLARTDICNREMAAIIAELVCCPVIEQRENCMPNFDLPVEEVPQSCPHRLHRPPLRSVRVHQELAPSPLANERQGLLLYVTNYKKGLTAPWRGPGPDVCCLQSRQRSLLRDAAGLAFPPDIIRHAVWLYLRFTLSYRDVEDLLAERGLTVSNESIRRWLRTGARGSARAVDCLLRPDQWWLEAPVMTHPPGSPRLW